MTLPQLNYYLKKCRKHVEFTIKVSTLGMGMFGGAGATSSEPAKDGTYINEDGKEVIEGYEVADVDDMEWLARIL